MAGEKPTSRREFLGGRAAARALLERMQALADRAAGTWSGETPPAVTPRRRAPSTVAHLHASRQSMACEFDIQYHAADGPVATSVAIGALDLIDQLESQLTVYRPTSEVMDVNRSAASRPVAVEPRLFALLELCAVLYDETGGAFDVTAGPLSRVWGFLVRQGRLPTGDEIKAARRLTGFDQVRLDIAARTVAFAQPGVEINFNAIGKGYALDRVAAHMAECGVDDYLCHGGRSSVLARGRDRGDDCGGWRIAVPHPFDPGRCVGEIVLRDAALGTSGGGTQFFEVEGRRYAHLIDPRTGRPAEGVLTATAVTDSAAAADALSTALFILGPGDAAEYCAAHPEVGVVMVCGPTSGPAFDVHVFNLDAQRWRPQ